MNITTPLRLLALAGLSLATFTTLSGCSDTDPTATDSHADHDHGDHSHDADASSTDSDSASASTPDIYPGVLGAITMLPIEGDASTELRIRHQHIPTFKSADGSINTNSKGIAGMASMKMPFPLADGVSTEGLSIGDNIRFTFEVIWTDNIPAWEVTQIEQIDASTVIDFSNKIDDLKDAAQEAAQDAMQDMPKLPGNTGP